MFGAKNAKIRQLEASVGQAAQEAAEMGPYLEMAREIQTQVGVLAVDGVRLEDAFTEVISDVSQAKRAETARRLFERLPVETQWEKLHAIYGDEEIRLALEERRQRELDKLANPIGEMQRIAQEQGMVDMTLLEPGQKVDFLFCCPDTLPYERSFIFETHTMALRIVRTTVEDQSGTLRVLSDDNDMMWGQRMGDVSELEKSRMIFANSKSLSDHTLLTFGTMDPSTDEFAPKLYFDTLAAIRIDGKEPDELYLDLAAVAVDGQSLLDR